MKGSLLVLLFAGALAAAAVFAPVSGVQDTLSSVSLLDARAELDMTVREIFARSCATSGCHSGTHPKLQLDLSPAAVPASLVGAASRQAGEFKLIDTEDPSKSYLLLKLTGGKGMRGKQMPLRAKALSAEEFATVSAWVAWFAGTGAAVDTAAVDTSGGLSAPSLILKPLNKEKR